MPRSKIKWLGLVLLVPVVLVAWLLPAGCGKKAISQEEALDNVRSAYRMMGESTGYRYHSGIKYSFPDMDETQKAQIASAIPSYVELEGEVQQQVDDYRKHSKTTSMGEQSENYVVDGVSYQYTEKTGWVKTDLSSSRLNLNSLSSFSTEDFENMLGFVGEIKVVEDSPEMLVLSFTAGSDYLLSSLEKNKGLYQTEEELKKYDQFYQLMSNSTTEITSYIYKDSGYLQKQEITMTLPNTPLIGTTVVMSFKSDFYDYGADIQIELPPEAAKARPA
jgi:hypothetical protein